MGGRRLLWISSLRLASDPFLKQKLLIDECRKRITKRLGKVPEDPVLFGGASDPGFSSDRVVHDEAGWHGSYQQGSGDF